MTNTLETCAAQLNQVKNSKNSKACQKMLRHTGQIHIKSKKSAI